MNAMDELKIYFEAQVKQSLLQLVEEEGGEVTLEVDYDTASKLNAVLQKHGLEVYGMAVRPSEFEVTFELGDKYVEISELPVRHCSIRFSNDGYYYVDIDDSIANESLWLGFGDVVFNFSKCSEEEVASFVDAMKKVHLLYMLSN